MNSQTPASTFVDEVKDALEHLYDFAYLQNHSLARQLQADPSTGHSASQHLRQRLMEAIEALSPGKDISFRAPQARLHSLLHLHYVEAMTVQECAHELGISQRQVYRDLRRGEENVAVLLWAQRMESEPRAVQLSSVQQEVERLITRPSTTDARSLVERAHKAVERLAGQRMVQLQVSMPPHPVTIQADPVMAQQVITGLFSRVVQQSQSDKVVISLLAGKEINCLQINYEQKIAGEEGEDVVAQLAARLKWRVDTQVDADGSAAVIIQMAAHGPTILVIDDNEGLVSLLERYLTDHACRVVAATRGDTGLQLAQDLLPDAIVLDVMMPEIDGWEVLQLLRARPETAATPVIICSVFNDPELALSLGADVVLPKPVSRSEVLNALHQAGVAF